MRFVGIELAEAEKPGFDRPPTSGLQNGFANRARSAPKIELRAMVSSETGRKSLALDGRSPVLDDSPTQTPANPTAPVGATAAQVSCTVGINRPHAREADPS